MRYYLFAKFSAHPDGQYIEAVWSGSLTDEYLISEITGYLESEIYIPGKPELVDLSQADLLDISADGMIKIADLLSKTHAGKNPKRKLAFYAPTESSFFKTILYSYLADKEIEDVEVFSDRLEAESWLK